MFSYTEGVRARWCVNVCGVSSGRTEAVGGVGGGPRRLGGLYRGEDVGRDIREVHSGSSSREVRGKRTETP